MAQAPQPPHRPAAPPPPPLKNPAEGKPPAVIAKQGEDEGPRPTIGVKGEPIDDGSRDPDTVAEEQRRRSAEIEGMGVEAWKAAHADHTPDENRTVAGVKKLENSKAP
jgi:hypothetical protein